MPELNILAFEFERFIVGVMHYSQKNIEDTEGKKILTFVNLRDVIYLFSFSGAITNEDNVLNFKYIYILQGGSVLISNF